MLFTILILISAFAVIKVISQIIMDRKCPSERTLKNVVLGRLPGDTSISRKVKRYLGICSKCRNKIDDIVKVNPADMLITDD